MLREREDVGLGLLAGLDMLLVLLPRRAASSMPTPRSTYASPVLAYALATSASTPTLVTYATGSTLGGPAIKVHLFSFTVVLLCSPAAKP